MGFQVQGFSGSGIFRFRDFQVLGFQVQGFSGSGISGSGISRIHFEGFQVLGLSIYSALGITQVGDYKIDRISLQVFDLEIFQFESEGD